MDMITRSSVFTVDPVIRLLKDVIRAEENREILQTDLKPMENFLPYISTVLHHDQLPEAAREALKVWLQLLHNCLTEAKSVLHRSDPPRLCLDCLMCNPGRLSKQIQKWKVHFNYVFQSLERDFSVFVSGREAIAPVIAPVIPLMKNVIREEENREILQTDLSPVDNLLLDISAVFQDQQKAASVLLKIWLQQLYNSLTDANSILHSYGPSQRQRHLDCLMRKQVKEWKVLFNYLFQGLQSDFSMFVSGDQIVNRDPIPLMSQEESVKPLSKDEAWMLFRRTAFKGNGVPTDIEEYATQIADECQGIPLAISLVAAAMMGKTTVDEWKASLSSIKNADPSSFPDTLDPQLYRPLRWTYDALPNSEVKNCFLYCAMYPKDEKIPMQDLVRLWIAEGLVRSKQENHLMDMAIGRSYVNLLVDHCFFQNASDEALVNIFLEKQYIRVHHVIHDMAIYIGEEENCLFKAGQELQDFPTIHNDYKRISLRDNEIENFPAEFPCPKLVSLFLSSDYSIEELPSRFLVSLESLKVLHLHSEGLESIPSSVGQLKQLESLRLKGLKNIHELPEEICHLSSLQFLDLSDCHALQSLPSKIGELINLKYLSLSDCSNLKVIPHEISQLTSLSTLDAYKVELSLEPESAPSIWSLKGLRNLNRLRINVEANVQEGITSSVIKEGIMGTWLEMRHLYLVLDDDVMVDLPHDMKNMRKLQSFALGRYHGSSLPDYTCKFRHLENIALGQCDHLRELSPLERLPNLKALFLEDCKGLKELGIGNSGRASGFLMLQKLVLLDLDNLESIAGPSNNGVWSESTLSRLRGLWIEKCPNLKRLPVGMDKLSNLITIFGEAEWWHQIIWENDDMKIHFENLFKEWSWPD